MGVYEEWGKTNGFVENGLFFVSWLNKWTIEILWTGNSSVLQQKWYLVGIN